MLRITALSLALICLLAMLYVGLYQSRVVSHLWCPAFGKGCEAVADAPFARPFGVPDGYIAAVLYLLILVLLTGPVTNARIWIPLTVLTLIATLANVLGVRDMARLGSFCFFCTLTTVLSPILLWLVLKLRNSRLTIP